MHAINVLSHGDETCLSAENERDFRFEKCGGKASPTALSGQTPASLICAVVRGKMNMAMTV
jgi:hypothetical protein